MLKKPSLEQKTLIASLYLGVILLTAFPLPVVADVQTKNKRLEGEVEQVDDNNTSLGKPSSVSMDNSKPAGDYIKGAIQQENVEAGKDNSVTGNEDPDAADKDLMIEWDQWRNRFLQAVLS